jgi:hypothetical protein
VVAARWCLASLLLAALPGGAVAEPPRPRARDLGIVIGDLPAGKVMS